MQPSSYFVVMNAGSGKKESQTAIEQVRQALADSGHQHEIFLAQNAQQLPLLAGRAALKARTFNGAPRSTFWVKSARRA